MFARTTRLTLRPGWPEEAALLAATIDQAMVGSGPTDRSPSRRARDAAACLAVPHGSTDVRLLIWEHEPPAPRLVGGIDLLEGDDPRERELAYWLTPAGWTRGYAGEAAQAVIDIARHALPVRHLVAWHRPDDQASDRLLAGLGFRETGRAVRPPIAAGGVESVRRQLDLRNQGIALALAA